MVNYAGLGDLYRICLEAQRAGANFNVAYIGGDFQAEHKVQFDQEYMRALYRFGYEKAVKGYPWGRAPPGFWEPGDDVSRAPGVALSFARRSVALTAVLALKFEVDEVNVRRSALRATGGPARA